MHAEVCRFAPRKAPPPKTPYFFGVLGEKLFGYAQQLAARNYPMCHVKPRTLTRFPSLTEVCFA